MSCSICTENLENKNRVYLECGHSFHCTCIFRLLSHNDKKCPNCRQEIKYEVPQTELNERLTRQDDTIKKLSEDISVISTEYVNLQSSHADALQKLLTSKIQHKVEMELAKEEKKKILADFILIKSEVEKLKERAPASVLKAKNNKISKLQRELKNARNEIQDLEETLFDITDKNIKIADKYDDLLNIMKSKINDMKVSSSRMKLQSRIAQPHINGRITNYTPRRNFSRNYNRR